MHLQEQYQNSREDIWMSYDLIYNRKKYNMNQVFAAITD